MFVPIYEQLMRMWREGLSLTEISNEFGVTRSVIAGAISRGRIKGHVFERRPNPIGRKPPPKLMKPEPLKRSHKPPKHYAYRPPPLPKPPRLLIDLDWNECRWSVDHAPDGRHLFCGDPKMLPLPYCEKHARISYPRKFGDKRTGVTCW